MFTDLGSFWPFLAKKTVRVRCAVDSSNKAFSSGNLEIYHLTLPLYVTSQRNHVKYDSIACRSDTQQSNDNK